MNWHFLAQSVVLFFVVSGGISLLRRKPLSLLCQLPLAMALGGFNVYAFGTIWSPLKVLTIYALLQTVVDSRWIGRLKMARLSLWWALAAWVLLCTLLGYLIEPSIRVADGAVLQSSSMRPLMQALSYLGALAIVPLVLLTLHKARPFETFMNAYAWAAVVALVGCGLQLVAYAAGLDFMPILRMHGEDSVMAAFGAGGSVVLRLYSFAGEPKQLALFLFPLLMAIVISMGEQRGAGSEFWWVSRPMFVLVFVVMVGTFSSAALIALAVSLVVVNSLFPRRSGRWAMTLGMASIGLFVLSVLLSILGGGGDLSVFDLIYERSAGRLESDLATRYETVALNFMFDEHLEYALTGVGLGMYNFHLPGMHWGRGIEPMDSGWVTQLMDLGLVGVFLLASMLGAGYLRGQRLFLRKGIGGQHLVGMASVAMLGSAIMNSGTNTFIWMMLWVAFLNGLVWLARSRSGYGAGLSAGAQR